jgi:hypothetical protein
MAGHAAHVAGKLAAFVRDDVTAFAPHPCKIHRCRLGGNPLAPDPHIQIALRGVPAPNVTGLAFGRDDL